MEVVVVVHCFLNNTICVLCESEQEKERKNEHLLVLKDGRIHLPKV